MNDRTSRPQQGEGSITDNLARLYQPHLQQAEPFVPCGVVDESSYLSQTPRALFLLKEVNDRNGNLREPLPVFLRKRVDEEGWKRLRMWKEASTWLSGLHYGFPDFNTAKGGMRHGLSCLAITNLKKSPGGPTSEMKEVGQVARSHQSLWTEELSVMDPTLVICGGTYGVVKSILKLKDKHSNEGARYAVAKIGGRERIFLHMLHPAARASSSMMYAFFKEAVSGLLIGHKDLLHRSFKAG